VKINRRQLGRDLSQSARCSVEQALQLGGQRAVSGKSRIGVTGAPGAGKSTLLASLARHRLDLQHRVAILAIDPSSPLTQGSILGDRIRMDAVADHPDLYIRSMPSRHAQDGLTDNVSGMLQVLENYPFDELYLETVGVGQVEYSVKSLVDTVVLVLSPQSGDAIQAMKAGILEMADIYVINKADLPGAEDTLGEIKATLALRANVQGEQQDAWRPQVVPVSSSDSNSIKPLSDAIDLHRQWQLQHRDEQQVQQQRLRYHVRSLLERRVNEAMLASGEDSDSVKALYQSVMSALNVGAKGEQTV